MLKIMLGENITPKHRNRTDLNIQSGTTTLVSRMINVSNRNAPVSPENHDSTLKRHRSNSIFNLFVTIDDYSKINNSLKISIPHIFSPISRNTSKRKLSKPVIPPKVAKVICLYCAML